MENYGATLLRLWSHRWNTRPTCAWRNLLENVANVYRNLPNRFRWISARSNA